MKKLLLIFTLMLIYPISAKADYYDVQHFRNVPDTTTVHNDWYWRGNFHVGKDSYTVDATAIPIGVVVYGSGTIIATDIQASSFTGTFTGQASSATWADNAGLLDGYNYDFFVDTTTNQSIGGDKTFINNIDAPTLNTGQGDNELYDMDQNVKTDSTPTFSSMTITNGLKADDVDVTYGIAVATMVVSSTFQSSTTTKIAYHASDTITMFENASAGDNEWLYLYGWRNSLTAKKYGRMRVDTNANMIYDCENNGHAFTCADATAFVITTSGGYVGNDKYLAWGNATFTSQHVSASTEVDFKYGSNILMTLNANTMVIKSSTTAGLTGTTPKEEGEVYKVAGSNYIAISTGTNTGNFGYIPIGNMVQ